MNELVQASLQFPTVVFTIALGIALVYWLFVLLGALDIDLLGHGDVDVAGAAKGIGDAITGGAKGGAEAVHGGHADVDADGDLGGGGIWSGLGLGAVPVTISVSIILLVCWSGSLLVMHYLIEGSSIAGWLAALLLVVVLIAALPIAALLVRPLAPVFAVREGKSNRDYVGHTCTITTGRVDDGFGQATIEDGGTVLVIAVRCDQPGKLGRGDKALIIEFDPGRQAYVVEPSADIIAAEPGPGPGDDRGASESA
ncbi:MAG TPA: hypothetical protein VN253_13960 [Kofleriaceae bacterium]|nr:hypothetical protein [Kofleriaceae bacterium]